MRWLRGINARKGSETQRHLAGTTSDNFPGGEALTIRPFEAGDAVEVSQVIEACFTQLDLGDHTPQGVHLQLFANRPEELIARSRTVSYFVAIEGDKILGICGHDRQRIHTLFVRPDRHRQGIGLDEMVKKL